MDNEIDFALVDVPQETQPHRVSLRVLDEVAVLEELAGHEVLEPRSTLRRPRPVPEMEFPLLLDGAHLRRTKRRDAQAQIEFSRIVSHRSTILWSTSRSSRRTPDRERGADAVWQQVDEVLDGEITHVLQVAQVVANHPRRTVALPDSQLALSCWRRGSGNPPKRRSVSTSLCAGEALISRSENECRRKSGSDWGGNHRLCRSSRGEPSR